MWTAMTDRVPDVAAQRVSRLALAAVTRSRMATSRGLSRTAQVRVGAATVQRKDTSSVRTSASVADTVTVLAPVVLGLPEICPVRGSMVRPAGRPEAVHVSGATPPSADSGSATVRPRGAGDGRGNAPNPA